MVSHSDDNGETWAEPFPLYASPGWNSVPMGGLAQIDGDHVQLMLGRIKQDLTLPGDEPITDWFMAAIDSHDGGRTWSDVGPEISLFPRERFYGGRYYSEYPLGATTCVACAAWVQ